MNKTLVTLVGIFTFSCLVGFYFWLTNNRYQLVSGGNGLAYEIDKKTGTSWELLADTRTLQNDPLAQQKLEEARIVTLEEKLPIQEQNKVDGNAALNEGSLSERLDSYSGLLITFAGKIYNGSSWKVTRIVFTIGVKEKNGKPIWTRDYSQKVIINPLQTASFDFPITPVVPKVIQSWMIKEVYGIQNPKEF